jgi:hypothetical protein
MNRLFTCLTLSTALGLLTACGGRKPVDPGAVVEACQDLETRQRTAVEQTAALVQAGQYAQAYAEFQKLRRQLPLSLEQEMAFNDLLLQLKKRVGKTAAPPATNAPAARR